MESPFWCDWGSNGGTCWGCVDVTAGWEPCCGQPCNAGDGVRCLVCFWCCAPCSVGKLLASTVDQDWHLVNHCLYPCFCYPCAATCVRHNLRNKHGVGDPNGEWVGDALMALFCSSCSLCQELRSVSKDDWDWLTDMQTKGLKVMTDFQFVRGGTEGQKLLT